MAECDGRTRAKRCTERSPLRGAQCERRGPHTEHGVGQADDPALPAAAGGAAEYWRTAARVGQQVAP